MKTNRQKAIDHAWYLAHRAAIIARGMARRKERGRAKEYERQRAKYAALSPEEKRKLFDYKRAWNKANPEKALAISRRHEARRKRHPADKYGADYQAMFAAQDGKCAVCETSEPGFGKRYFAVDHDHDTGEVRALLCMGCNAAIGLLKEDPDRIYAAAEYVRVHKARRLKAV